jgi:methyltransferase
MVTFAFVVLVLAVAIQRMLEVRVSRLNEAELKARGGIEDAREQMPVMVAVHTAWLVVTLLEVLLLDRPVHRGLMLIALLAFCAGQVLRLSAIQALGGRWTVKVITLPGEPPVTRGIFRYLRHPNYLGVILEIAALPLVHSAYLSAILFSVLNGLLLRQRIRAEERALGASSDYGARFRDHGRLVPKLTPKLPQSRERQT